MHDTRIRDATLADAGVIVAANAALARESEGRALDLPTLGAGVRRQLTDPVCGRYFLAERDGQVVGQMLITYEWSDWRNGRWWWIQSVYVAPHARRTGVYRALHEYVRRLARESGEACGMRVFVDRDNPRAHATYTAMGMRDSHYDTLEDDWVAPRA